MKMKKKDAYNGPRKVTIEVLMPPVWSRSFKEILCLIFRYAHF